MINSGSSRIYVLGIISHFKVPFVSVRGEIGGASSRPRTLIKVNVLFENTTT